MEVELPDHFQLRQLEESIRVLEREQVELINVPVPEFDDFDSADIVHDFHRVRRLEQTHQCLCREGKRTNETYIKYKRERERL